MVLKPENLYHPFLNNSFGLFAGDESSEEDVVGSIIDDINLYYQPTQKPLIALLFIALKIIILIVGGYLHVKVFKQMTKENGILKDVTRLFTCANSLLWPFLTFFSGITDFIHPMNKVAGQWFCDVCEFIFYFLGNIMTFHSLVAALMRYVFIVHREKVSRFGKEKAKRLFFYLSFSLPMLVSLWELVNGTELDSMSFINKCNGKHHKTFLLESSTTNVARRNFCGFEDYQLTDIWSQIIALIRRISCIANKIIMVVMGLNVVEGLLYWQIWTHINR